MSALRRIAAVVAIVAGLGAGLAAPAAADPHWCYPGTNHCTSSTQG